jgi:hypothetical protein
MSEKREFPILNGKLMSDLDLNGHKLLGNNIPEGGGGGGGGSSVEVVAPSADGKGKAADAKAVYEGLERKLNKSDVVTPTEEAQKGQAADAKAVHDALEEKRGKTDLTVDANAYMLPADCFPIAVDSLFGMELSAGDFRVVPTSHYQYGDIFMLEVDSGTRFVEVARFSAAGVFISDDGLTFNGRRGEPGS